MDTIKILIGVDGNRLRDMRENTDSGSEMAQTQIWITAIRKRVTERGLQPVTL